MLELYTTVSRSQVEEDELILEESVDGMDFVAGTIFADAESGSGTDVTFRLGYYLPGETHCSKPDCPLQHQLLHSIHMLLPCLPCHS